jgi:hypothetical protein
MFGRVSVDVENQPFAVVHGASSAGIGGGVHTL